MQPLLFSKTFICKGTKLPHCCSNWHSFSLVPRSRIACHLVSEHTCVTLLPDAYSGGCVLSQAFLLQNMVHLYIWLHLYLLFSYLSNKATFMQLPFAKIDKNSLSCRSWRDNENVDSPLEPPQRINNCQERLIDKETARTRGKETKINLSNMYT